MRPKIEECVAQGNGRYNYGRSLYLVVRGARAFWEGRYRDGDKVRSKCLGSATSDESLSIKRADEKWEKFRSDLRGGLLSTTAAAPAVRTLFAQARDKYLEAHANEWTDKVRADKRAAFKHAAVLDARPCGSITTEELAELLRPGWKGPQGAGSNRVRALIEGVLSMAGVEPNPATWERLQHKLSKKVEDTEHHASLPWQEVPALMAELVAKNGTPIARALRLVILTATRVNEVLGARWGEFDLTAKTWTIPKERMRKAKRPHVVPLSDEAVALLGKPGKPDALVFLTATGKRIADASVRRYLQTYRDDVTTHGFRTSFSTWAEEQDHGRTYPASVIEAALAHAKGGGDPTTAAYLRSDLFAARRELMADWAKYALSGVGR